MIGHTILDYRHTVLDIGHMSDQSLRSLAPLLGVPERTLRRAAMAEFGQDFDLDVFQKAYDSDDPMELNRVKAVERGSISCTTT